MMNETRPCEEYELLMQADIDGELDAAEAAAVTAHRNQCMQCMVRYKELMSLRERVRDRNYHKASDQFRARLMATLAAAQKAAQPPRPVTEPVAATQPAPAATLPPAPAIARPAAPPRRPWWRDLGTFAAGGVLASCLLLPLLLRSPEPNLPAEVVAGHIRAMQANHLLDIVSTDQHNVKPWFEGKVDFAPPVKNLAAQGFPLTGGRLDYVDQRSVAVMVYQGGKHPINLFAWPDPGANSLPAFSSLQGYNVAHWTQDGMSLWAVSDMNVNTLAQFTETWRAQ